MKLKELRINKKLTQQEVANSLNITRMKYNHYELGNSEPNIDLLIKLANFYKVTIDELLGHEVPYTLNRVEFSQEQLELIEQIKSLNAKQCEKVGDFVSGIIEAQKIKDNTLKRFQ